MLGSPMATSARHDVGVERRLQLVSTLSRLPEQLASATWRHLATPGLLAASNAVGLEVRKDGGGRGHRDHWLMGDPARPHSRHRVRSATQGTTSAATLLRMRTVGFDAQEVADLALDARSRGADGAIRRHAKESLSKPARYRFRAQPSLGVVGA